MTIVGREIQGLRGPRAGKSSAKDDDFSCHSACGKVNDTSASCYTDITNIRYHIVRLEALWLPSVIEPFQATTTAFRQSFSTASKLTILLTDPLFGLLFRHLFEVIVDFVIDRD